MSKLAISRLDEIWFLIKETRKRPKNLFISFMLVGGLFSILLYCETYIPPSGYNQASATNYGAGAPPAPSIKKAHCQCNHSDYPIHSFMSLLAPPAYASPGGIVTTTWVFGSGNSFQQAKEKARQDCNKLVANAGKVMGELFCYEGSYRAGCSCQKVKELEGDKVEIKTSGGYGSAYTKGLAISKAQADCQTSYSAVRMTYDKSSRPNAKTKIIKCGLTIDNQKHVSADYLIRNM